MSLRTVDLFCGCGGLSLGLKKAGFDVVLGVDHDDRTMAVYRRNNADHAGITLDLSDRSKTFQILDFFQPEVIAGGPPCQDYSSAGKRNEGDRASLTLEFAHSVIHILPKVFIMENVAPAQRSETYKLANDIFRKAGYGLTQRVLDASRCGVPQKRQRLFVVGSLSHEDGWLDETIDSRLSEEAMTVRQYMGDELDVEHYYRHPRSYERRGVFSLDEPSATIRGVNRNPSPSYKAHKGDFADPSEVPVRALTTYERSRVQTFPKDFSWPGDISKSALEQMIGNAVPVELGAFVGDCVSDRLGLSVNPGKGRRKASGASAERDGLGKAA